MYLYKKIKTSVAALVLITNAAFYISCQSQESSLTLSEQYQEDLPKFFNKEVERLIQRNPTIRKTVVKDSISESKTLTLKDWKRELSSFSNIDLNKLAYQGVFKKDSVGTRVIYTSTDPKIDISKVIIDYQNTGSPSSFLIHRKVENSLYDTRETLSYDISQGYSIEKKQHIFILGDKYYHIKGDFNN